MVFLVVICIVAASVIVLLRDMGILPLSVKLCSKSNRWGYLCTEISKYWVLFRAVQTTLLNYYGDNKIPSPFLDVPELEQPLKNMSTSNVAYDAYWHMVYMQVQVQEMRSCHGQATFGLPR
jgi:hypothetical protein